MRHIDDITAVGTYEVHPATDRDGRETGWYAVVQSTTGEVLSRHATREDAVADATWRRDAAADAE